MTNETERRDEHDRVGDGGIRSERSRDPDAGSAPDEAKPESADEQKERDERQASTSMEHPSNVTRSTQDLTVGGSKETPAARKPQRTTEPSSRGASREPGQGRSN